jgi:hypothetical protein
MSIQNLMFALTMIAFGIIVCLITSAIGIYVNRVDVEKKIESTLKYQITFRRYYYSVPSTSPSISVTLRVSPSMRVAVSLMFKKRNRITRICVLCSDFYLE